MGSGDFKSAKYVEGRFIKNFFMSTSKIILCISKS